MAKIPIGNFGQAMPNVQRINLPQDQTGQIIASALQNIGQQVGQYAEVKEEQQRKKDTLTASTIASQFALDAELLSADYRQKVSSGQMADTSADLEFSKEYAVKMEEALAHIPQSVNQAYKENFMKYGSSQVGLLYQTGRSVASDTAKTNLKLTINNAAKMGDQVAAAPIIENAFDAASEYLSPAERLEYQQSYRQQQESNNLGYRLATAKTKEEYESIYSDLEDENKYQNIQGGARNNALQASQSGIVYIEKQEQKAQADKEREANKLVSDLESNILSGGAISLDYINNIAAATKGTSAETDFNFWANNYTSIQKFANNMDTNQQKAFLNKLDDDFKKNPSDNASDRKKLLDVYKHIYNGNISAAKNDNVAAASGLGIEVKPIVGSELLANPDKAMGSIIDNILALNQAKKYEPNINLDPIPSENKLDIQQSFSQAGAKKQLDVLASIMKVSNQKGISKSAVKGIIKTIGGGDGTYLNAATAIANNAVYRGKNTGYIILSGASSIKSGNQITPTDLQEDYRSKISNLANGGDYSAGWDAFKSAYAYFESQSGHIQKSKDDGVNTESFNKALDATTGGLYQQLNTNFFNSGKFKTSTGSVGDWQVQKPYLMSNQQFDVLINSGLDQVAKKHGLPPEFVKNNFRLQAREGTTYDKDVIYDLLDADGNRWSIKGKNGETDKQQFIIIQNYRR